MNILFLAPQLPYPGKSGGTLNSRKLLDYFCSKHSVTLISLMKKEDVDNLSNFHEVYHNKIKQFFYFKIDKPRSLLNYVCSLFHGIPLMIYRNYSPTIKEKIRKIAQEHNFDIVFCDYLLMTQYIPKTLYHKTVFNDNNAEYMIWKRFSTVERNILKKLVIRFEAYRIFRYEIKECGKISMIVAASEDIKQLQPYTPKSNFVAIYHLGNDDLLCEKDMVYKQTHRLLFIGTMTWEANIYGIDWFIRNVYGHIKEQYPDISLWIAGKYATEPDYARIDNSIHVLGFVDDLKPLYEVSDIFICPLRFGSGTKIKLLDAMYRGLPIVTTSIGAESIDLVDGETCFIADTSEEFAKKTLLLLNDSDVWDTFSKNSRALAKKQYRWEDEYHRLETLLDKFH